MRFLLGSLVVVLNLLDNATTFVCLTASVPGYDVFEANPLARWLFDAIGLIEGLALEMLFTTIAVGFLVLSGRIPHRARLAVLAVLVALPAWAVANNVSVMLELGIPVLGPS